MSKILCNCKDSQGNPKQSYLSKKLADEQKNFIKEDRCVSLDIYKCPENSGWHLTKGNNASVHFNSLNYASYSPSQRGVLKKSIGSSLGQEVLNELKKLQSKLRVE